MVIYVVKNASRPKSVMFHRPRTGSVFCVSVCRIVTLSGGLCKSCLRSAQPNMYGAMVCQLLLCDEMLRRNMVPDFQTYRSVFCPEGGDVPWTLNWAG